MENNKKSNIRTVIIIVGSLLSLGFVTFLLWEGKIDPQSFTYLFLGIIIIAVALYLLTRLKEFDVKGVRLVLQDLQKTQEDIYAKEETLRKVGEELADLTAYNITRIGRGAPDDLKPMMIKARNTIKNALVVIGSDEPTTKKILLQIEDMILHDLKWEIQRKIEDIKKGFPINRVKITDTLTRLLYDDYNRSSLIKYLKEKDVYEEELDPFLDRLDKFIETKEL